MAVLQEVKLVFFTLLDDLSLVHNLGEIPQSLILFAHLFKFLSLLEHRLFAMPVGKAGFSLFANILYALVQILPEWLKRSHLRVLELLIFLTHLF